MSYDITEHRHRFSVWAAARATQRGFTSVDVLRNALEGSGVIEFLARADAFGTNGSCFRTVHKRWCRSICASLEARHANATFGRAAKLIAIYMKSMVVLVRPDTALAKVAHPPIDSILLRNVARSREIQSPHKNTWAKIKWTQLNEASYYILVDQLLSVVPDGEPFWMLEQFWTVSDESD